MTKSSSKQEQGSGTTWERIKSLKLSHKLALTYTIAFTILLGITFTIIYLAVENFRKIDFYNGLKTATLTRYRMLVEVGDIDIAGVKLLDRSVEGNTSVQQILLFDSSGQMLYNSKDDNDIAYTIPILEELKGEDDEVQITRDEYQYVGVRFLYHGTTYYGIAKGQDEYGLSKMDFLGALLIVSFFIVVGVSVIISFYLSKMITSPVTMLTRDISEISPDNLSVRVRTLPVNDEIGFLANKFNQLLEKVESAFRFQRHFVHHLSHELKTPLAIMLTNVERTMSEGDEETMKANLQFQKNALMDLSNVINAMMDISKSETQLANVLSDTIRVDELLFECMDEINFLNDEAQFDFVVDEQIHNDDCLIVTGNSRMLKMAIMNLLKNAINYSSARKPLVELISTQSNICIRVLNDGLLISPNDREQLFRQMFRGENSKGVKGFGLGLVLTQRIITLHKGVINYSITEQKMNCFEMCLPLAS